MSTPSESNPAPAWDFPGWGTSARIADLSSEPVALVSTPHAKKLGVWASTAICGNDISSSCLYVSALCAAQAGAYAPIALGLVVVVLYLFRSVYAEVGSALPLNGGTYTVLLNTTNKRTAAAAACLTLLSYVATAVISASEAMHYAHNLWDRLDVTSATVGLLGLFAFLNILGIAESAVVAIVIFVFHLTTLTVLAIACSIVVTQDPSLFWTNWQLPPAGGIGHALFFGFSAALLGISGFESSANFIEEQRAGVFPKTLRNMWLVVATFNPLISLLSLGLLPLADIQQAPPDLLAQMGALSLGEVLRTWVSIDAVLVLSGAVLTSYVGVTGLIKRMSLDQCLPQFLLRENRLRGTNHLIILAFFAVCCSILFSTSGHVTTLAGVYTISFLSVMALFAIGNMLLKVKRAALPRKVRASWLAVTTALLAVGLGLVGNVLLDPETVRIFMLYFAGAVALVGVMFLRVSLLRLALYTSRAMVQKVLVINRWVDVRISSKIQQINCRKVIYFAKGDSPAELNRAAIYVLDNEITNHLVVVHVAKPGEEVPPQLAEHLSTIDHLYPQLRIDFLSVEGDFGPILIGQLSRRLAVPQNYMFIGTPGDHFPHRIETLGGVRLIL